MKWKHLQVFTLLLFLSMTFTVACKSKNDDATIQAEVTNKISTKPGVTASVKDGVVVLSGDCPDADCKTSAENAVKEVKGVKSVVNNINVVAAMPADQAPVEISGDEQLTTSVNDAIKDYKDVKAEVKDGVVTLKGQIKRDDLQKLMMSLNSLHPKKIENKLVIK